MKEKKLGGGKRRVKEMEKSLKEGGNKEHGKGRREELGGRRKQGEDGKGRREELGGRRKQGRWEWVGKGIHTYSGNRRRKKSDQIARKNIFLG